MHSKKELDQRLSRAGIQPLKSLGQNFLVNPEICRRIVSAVEEWNPRFILEVGPGLGALTEELFKINAERFALVELDRGLVDYWSDFKSKAKLSFEIIHDDALRVDWENFEVLRPSVLVSNLPYSIAASIVMELSLFDKFDGMVLMFQKEVAERIQAPTRSEAYGLLSVVAQNFWEIKKLIDAGPQDFHPVPNVGSRVLTFKRSTGDAPRDPQKFISFVKRAFSQRRKKLLTNLGSGYEKNSILKGFGLVQIDEQARAQDLSPEQFRKLQDLLDFQLGS